MAELHEHRIKRLRMRSMRRGIKEMDIILDRFAQVELDRMTPDALDQYDSFLEENDQDLYRWVTGQEAPPERFAALIARIEQVMSAG